MQRDRLNKTKNRQTGGMLEVLEMHKDLCKLSVFNFIFKVHLWGLTLGKRPLLDPFLCHLPPSGGSPSGHLCWDCFSSIR